MCRDVNVRYDIRNKTQFNYDEDNYENNCDSVDDTIAIFQLE